MEIKKISICQTAACVLCPCKAYLYEKEAEKDSMAALLARGLRVTALGFSGFAAAAFFTGRAAFLSKDSGRSILGCMTLTFAFMAAISAERLYHTTLAFRNHYLSSSKVAGPVLKNPFCEKKEN
jgi:hypothetical protein